MSFQELLSDHSEEDLRQSLVVSLGEYNAETSGKATQETESQRPTQTQIVPYKNVNYEIEKRQGLRRANGARKLKKLSNRHLQIISRHLQGQSGETIAASMNITIITVSRVLNDPMAKELLGVIYKDRQSEIDALAGKAIKVVRDGLDESKDLRVRLQAVDKYTKLKDSIGSEESAAKSAEDVVQEIFAGLKIEGENVQINIGKKDG